MFCAISIAGCSGHIKNEMIIVPDYLLADEEVPVFIGETNGELIEYIILLRENIELCNADKTAIKELLGVE